jgi:hypothetical protein
LVIKIYCRYLRLTLLISVYHCIVTTSDFGTYDARNPALSVDANGLGNRFFQVGETRKIIIDAKDPLSQQCNWTPRGNYQNPARGIVRGYDPRYYIKKRLSAKAGAQHILRYQYIASRDPIVVPLYVDLHSKDDPLPPNPKRPNEFKSTLGWIFCETNTLKGMVVRSGSHSGCGIEETLVALCLRDDHHVMQSIFTHNTLDFDDLGGKHLDIYEEISAGTQFESLQSSAWTVVDHILHNGDKIAKIPKPQGRGVEKMREYLRGAELAGFEFFVLKNNFCPEEPTWNTYDIDFHLLPAQRQVLTDLYANSDRNWYVVKY